MSLFFRTRGARALLSLALAVGCTPALAFQSNEATVRTADGKVSATIKMDSISRNYNAAKQPVYQFLMTFKGLPSGLTEVFAGVEGCAGSRGLIYIAPSNDVRKETLSEHPWQSGANDLPALIAQSVCFNAAGKFK
jgi:hypothetical protein